MPMRLHHQSIFANFKLLLLTSCVSIVALSGCQTTTGIQSGSNRSSSLPNTQTLPIDIASTPSNNRTIVETSFPEQVLDSVDDDYTDADDSYRTEDTIISSIEVAPTPDTRIGTEAGTEAPIYTPQSSNQTSNNPASNSQSSSNPSQITQNAPVINQRPKRPDAKTTQQILTERARKNPKQPSNTAQAIANGDNIPAFRRLMDTGIKQLKQGQIAAAQSTFTRAQRLAPQSSAVYFYLGQVALKQNQPLKAEAMARRGLVVAQSQERKTALWQLILRSAELQGNQRVIKEARQALSK